MTGPAAVRVAAPPPLTEKEIEQTLRSMFIAVEKLESVLDYAIQRMQDETDGDSGHA